MARILMTWNRPAVLVTAATVAAVLLALGGCAGDRPTPTRNDATTPAQATTPTEDVSGVEPTPDPDVFDPDVAAAIPIGGPDVRLSNGTRGVVQLQFDRRPRQLIRRTDVPRFPRNAAFGAVVLAADLTGDRRGELVLGAGKPARAGGASPSGGVHILRGGKKDVVNPANDTVITSPGTPGDGFGAAVAVSSGAYGVDLWVGAPGSAVDGVRGAGAVYRYRVHKGRKATLVDTVTLPSSKQGDGFGQVLVSMVRTGSGIIVGVPMRDVGDSRDAGSVAQVLIPEDDPRELPTPTPVEWTQDSPGVPGFAEPGDHFGASVAVGGTAVGIPGEDLGAKTDAGAVQLFDTEDGDMSPGEQVTLDSHDTARWTAAAGDRFGTALAAAFSVEPTNNLYIGAPGRDAGGRRDVGEVFYFDTVLFDPEPPPNSATNPKPAQSLRLGAGLPGAAVTGARLGQSLGTRFGLAGFDEDYWSEVLVGAPGAAAGRGAVFHFRNRQTESATRYLPETPGWTGFGSVVPALTPNT